MKTTPSFNQLSCEDGESLFSCVSRLSSLEEKIENQLNNAGAVTALLCDGGYNHEENKFHAADCYIYESIGAIWSMLERAEKDLKKCLKISDKIYIALEKCQKPEGVQLQSDIQAQSVDSREIEEPFLRETEVLVKINIACDRVSTPLERREALGQILKKGSPVSFPVASAEDQGVFWVDRSYIERGVM